MSGTRYVVQRGDTLWGLARQYLGDPVEWSKLYEHNNSAAVVALTKTRISDPDLIFVGQVLYLPNAGAAARPPIGPRPPSARPKPGPARSATPPRPGPGAGSQVRGIPFKYSFDALPPIAVVSPVHIATVKLTGSVTLQPEKAIDFVELTKNGVEVAAKREADLVFAKLVSETKVGLNPVTKQISFENGITVHSSSPYAPTTSASVGISSTTGLPMYKTTIKAPKIAGKIQGYLYVTSGLGIEIEITPVPPSARPRPVPSARPRPVPVASPSGWEYLAAAGLVAAGAVLIVATIAEDVATLGVGVADDVPSFAAASAMIAGGLAVFSKVQGSQPVQIEGAGHAPPTL